MFQKGHAKVPGSGIKRGQLTATTRILKEAAILAAEAAAEKVGTTKKEKEAGLVGYLTYVAVNYPPAFMTLLCKIMPDQLRMELQEESKTTVVFTSREDVVKELQDRGIPHRVIPFLNSEPEIIDAEIVADDDNDK